MEKKRITSKPRKVKCAICETIFSTTHSQGKYCSLECKREGERASWRKYGKKNRQRRHSYWRQYYLAHIEEITERIRLYQQNPAGKQVREKCDRNQRLKYPEKYQARQEVLKAVRSGKLTKLPCRFCGVKQVEAHHPDYGKPLEIIWLCHECHRILHKILKDIEDGEIRNEIDTELDSIPEVDAPETFTKDTMKKINDEEEVK